MKIKFDPEQTEFASDYQRRVWNIGVHIVPLDVSLADVTDPETCEACMQIYDFTTDLISDMYENWEDYAPVPVDHYVDRVFEWACTCFTHRTANIDAIFSQLRKLGFECERNKTQLLLSNEKYPLYMEHWAKFNEAAWKRKLNIDSYRMYCDFRVLAPKYTRTLDDILRPLPSQTQRVFRELHEYALSKGAKLESHKYYGRMRYLYKKRFALIFEQRVVEVPMRVPATPTRDAFFAFLSLAERQPDKDALVEYISNNTDVCNNCGRPSSSKHISCADRFNLRVEILGKRRALSICHFGIGKAHYGWRRQTYTDADIPMLKRMIDLRIAQLDTATTK
jgi:hypothetical protein